MKQQSFTAKGSLAWRCLSLLLALTLPILSSTGYSDARYPRDSNPGSFSHISPIQSFSWFCKHLKKTFYNSTTSEWHKPSLHPDVL